MISLQPVGKTKMNYESKQFGIKKYLDFLTHNLVNLNEILPCLIQKALISMNGWQSVLNESTTINQNYKLLTILQNMNWERIRLPLLVILNTTGNRPCADLLSNSSEKPRKSRNIEEWPERDFEDDILSNLHTLSSQITSFQDVLNSLIAEGFVSAYERDEIDSQSTDYARNRQLLLQIARRGPAMRYHFLKILFTSSNKHLLYHFEWHVEAQCGTIPGKNCLLISKWWPADIPFPNAFQERKSEGKTLVKIIKSILSTHENKTTIAQMVVISGLAGVGKSTTAKWYALEYESKYDHIFWLDCGEKRLFKSFLKLARVLKVGYIKQLELKILASDCFDILKECQCLWIYDNAEGYTGTEGIKKVLPVNKSNFDVIITSRNRQWGNETGLGIIPQFLLTVFDLNEAFDFIKTNLKEENVQESKLQKLCQIVGNLPLALQIAISTLNQDKIALTDYISCINKTNELITTPFDAYEKSINQTMQISLETIKQHECDDDGLSYNILNTFGYTTSKGVNVAFFSAVEDKGKFVIDRAINLLKKYSLVTVNDENKTVSIHPLLQQVIRHNGKYFKDETISKILKCKGFLPYLLSPFCFADKELRSKFPEVESEIFAKIELPNLLNERRFEEAVQLSSLIKDKNPTSISVYNYTLCLKYNLEMEEATILLKHLYENSLRKSIVSSSSNDDTRQYYFGILPLDEFLFPEIIAGELFLIHFNDENQLSGIELIKQTEIVFKSDEDSIKELTIFLISIPGEYIRRFSYDGSRTRSHDNFATIHLIDSTSDMLVLKFTNCSLDENNFPRGCKLRQLYLSQVKISLNIPTLISCSLIQKLTLTDMLGVDLSDDFTVEELNLKRVLVTNWKRAKWRIEKLTVEGNCYMAFLRTNSFSYAELIMINDSPIDLSDLPLSIKMLIIRSSDVIWQTQLHDNINLIEFTDITFKDVNKQNLQQLDVSTLLPRHIKTLKLETFSDDQTKLIVKCSSICFIEDLHLSKCILILPWEDFNLCPTRLTLERVSIFEDSKQLEKKYVVVNEFVNFRNTQYLKLQGNFIIDLSDEIKIREVSLNSVQVLDWKQAKWTVDKLTLSNVPFSENKRMLISELIMEGLGDDNRLNPDCLPFQTIRKLALHNTTIGHYKLHPPGQNNMQLQLKELIIDNVNLYHTESHSLTSWLICTSLNKVQWANMKNHIIPFDLFTFVPCLQFENCILYKHSNVSVDHEKVTFTNVEIIDESNEKNNIYSLMKGACPLQNPITNAMSQLEISSKLSADDKTEDFPITELGVVIIKKALENRVESLKEEWEYTIPLSLGLSGKSMGEIEEYKGKFGNRIIKTLRLWMKEKGAEATFDALIKGLEFGNDKIAEEEILAKREAIRMASI